MVTPVTLVTISEMAEDFAATRAAVTEYMRDFIRAQLRRKRKPAEIAKQLGITRTYVIQLSEPEKYGAARLIGPEPEFRLAGLLHGGSIDALRKAALHVAAGGITIVEDSGQAVEIASDSSDAVAAGAQENVGRRVK